MRALCCVRDARELSLTARHDDGCGRHFVSAFSASALGLPRGYLDIPCLHAIKPTLHTILLDFPGVNLELYQDWSILVWHALEELLPLLAAFNASHLEVDFLFVGTWDDNQILISSPLVSRSLTRACLRPHTRL